MQGRTVERVTPPKRHLRCTGASTLLVLATLVPVPASATTLVNASFETLELVCCTGVAVGGNNFPDALGDWEGDPATIVTGVQADGVAPLDGIRMLRFDSTFPTGAVGAGSDVTQLVSVAGVNDGLTTITLSSHFNRVVGDTQTDTEFRITVRSLAGSPADFSTTFGSAFAEATATLISDADLNTWEPLTLDYLVPTQADYLSVIISAIENVSNDAVAGAEFDGHYADALSISAAVPAPPSSMLVIAGLACLAGAAARRRAPR